jgi:P27 family predicted phage terminase small subunit
VKGRKPKPTLMKALEGNPGHRPLNTKEPRPKSAVPTCPNHLKGVARQEWTRVTRELHALGILALVDRSALAAYCTAYKDYVRAENTLKKEGEVLVSDKGVAYQNPWMRIKKQSMDQMVRFGAEFGMTPSSRARVKVETPSEEEELEKMLFGKNVKVKT